MAVTLPTNPHLERFRRDARRLQRAARVGDPEALDLVARHHPDGAPPDPAGLTLAAAQLVVARAHGFPSWPRLRHFLDSTASLRRDLRDADLRTLADRVLDRACLHYTEKDDPARWAEAAAVLAANPELVDEDVHVAAAAGDPDALRRHLERDPGLAVREGGPFRWPPLLHLTYARVPGRDPVAAARVLLDAGADPSAGYLWGGLTPPFTALTGCFGEGEQGPGRQPRHPQGEELAELLLSAGADANDGQALYNRMFGRDDGHLVLLLRHGLGTGDGGVWRRRLGEATESPAEMMARQVAWAQRHGLTARLSLLAEHGFTPADRHRRRRPSVHAAGSPEAVAAAVAAGADVDAYERGRSALHHQAWIGDVEMVRALLAAGADPDRRDDEHGTTPLAWAEHARQPATAALLRSVTRSSP